MTKKLGFIRRFTHKQRGKLIIQSYTGIIKSRHKVLDIGCYDGTITKNLQEHFNCDMECADICNFLDYSFKFHFIEDFKIVGVEDTTFDIAMINDTLHHIPYENQIRLIKEAQRVSKKVLVFESYGILTKAMDVFMNKGKMEIALSFRKSNEWLKILKDFSEYKVKIPFYYPQKQFCFIQYEPMEV